MWVFSVETPCRIEPGWVNVYEVEAENLEQAIEIYHNHPSDYFRLSRKYFDKHLLPLNLTIQVDFIDVTKNLEVIDLTREE